MHYISLIKLQYIQLRHNFSSLHTKKGILSSSFAKTWQVQPSKKLQRRLPRISEGTWKMATQFMIRKTQNIQQIKQLDKLLTTRQSSNWRRQDLRHRTMGKIHQNLKSQNQQFHKNPQTVLQRNHKRILRSHLREHASIIMISIFTRESLMRSICRLWKFREDQISSMIASGRTIVQMYTRVLTIVNRK